MTTIQYVALFIGLAIVATEGTLALIWLEFERELRKANPKTFCGMAIHYALDTGESIDSILKVVKEQLKDDEINADNRKYLPKALGEGYDFFKNNL